MTEQRPGLPSGSHPPVRIVPAASSRAIAIVRRLFREYAKGVGEPLCFEGFDGELARLPRPYAPPVGALLLAFVGAAPAGVVGTRLLSPRICEMKRLYVPPPFRGLGVGRALPEAIIGEARRLGFERMRLDSLDSMRVARKMYRRLGFREIRPYLPPVVPKTHYMELRL
ncbi:MAG: GNAT family N-acetyltransferase [Thermoplasmata archaeon]|nr:GNAT family N-acetyltransferase [Thermoplasmata archaeon]